MADSVLSALSKDPAPHYGTFRGAVGPGDISIDVGMPLNPTGELGEYIFAQANAGGTANVAGLASSASERAGYRNGHVNIQFTGPLTLTTDQWDRVTGGSGGLTPNAVYYLSPVTAGLITTLRSVTLGQFVVPIGFATSPTTMMIQIGAALENLSP